LVKSFLNVSDRFAQDLEQINRGFVAKEAEPKMEQLIRGMRFLKIQVYPMEAFEEAAEFMERVAKLFDAASGSRIKTALAETLTQLLSSVVTVRTVSFFRVVWNGADVLFDRRRRPRSIIRFGCARCNPSILEPPAWLPSLDIGRRLYRWSVPPLAPPHRISCWPTGRLLSTSVLPSSRWVVFLFPTLPP
jgi:hypothetical protein